MTADVVRIREPWTALARVCLPLFYTAPFGLNAWSPSGGPVLRIVWALVVLAVLTLLAVAAVRREGVDLTPHDAVSVGLGRTRVVPWRDVQAVAFDRRGRVVLHRAAGGDVALRYPARGMFVRGRDVEADYHRIGRWWLAHRGPDWRPVFVPPPPPPFAYAPYPPPPGDATARSIEEIWRSPPEGRR